MKIYNSLTRRKEDFVPLDGKNVKMYACGITVSGNAHIGHLFQALIFDIISKYLRKKGYNVTYARNYTDIDDKIIATANKLGIDSNEYAKKMIAKTDKEMQQLHIDDPDIWIKATATIPEIIDFVNKLIEKNHAYATPNGDVYFDVSSFPSYGKLSNRNIEESLNGVRIDNDEQKRNPLDFALWKSAKPDEPSWKSPWGNGRPGWHIECSAMNIKIFGEQIDIHGGGRDLIFPHHENEIAQTEALTGKPFSKYWIHNGLIKINGQKMSKSLGNGLLIQDLLNKYHPETIKFALLQINYRNDFNLLNNTFNEAEKHLGSFYKIIKEIEESFELTNERNMDIEKSFDHAMNDDFNTAKAIADLFGIFKNMTLKLQKNDKTVVADLNAVKNSYSLLGLFKSNSNDFFTRTEKFEEPEIPGNVKELAEKRWNAKLQKNWAEADNLRKEITELGYAILDTKEGYTITKI